MSKGRIDVVGGNVGTTLLVLALPVLGEQLLNSFVGIYDTYLAGTISKEATGAIGLAAYVGWLASMLFGLIGTGTTALVSRFWGAGNYEDANRVANRSVSLAVVIGVVCYTLIYSLAPTFASLQNMRGEAYDIVVRYLRLDALGYLFTSVTLVGAAALRGAGDMRSPMLLLAFVNFVNVVTSTCLVLGVGPFPELGVDGIVTGTVTARACGGLLMLALLQRGLSGLRLQRKELGVRGDLVRRILRIGVPSASEGAILWCAHFTFLMIIGRVFQGEAGKAAYAAHIIAIRVEALTYLPAMAWGVASATMIGQSLGAEDRARALRVGHQAALQCSILACLAGLVYFFGSARIYGVMHEDPSVGAIGAPAMRVLAFFQPMLAVALVYSASLRGAGDTRYPLLYTSFSSVFVRLPVAYLFGIHLRGGLMGAWVGMCADMTVRALLAALRYSRGKWVDTKV